MMVNNDAMTTVSITVHVRLFPRPCDQTVRMSVRLKSTATRPESRDTAPQADWQGETSSIRMLAS